MRQGSLVKTGTNITTNSSGTMPVGMTDSSPGTTATTVPTHAHAHTR
jgi:hypothetical protein